MRILHYFLGFHRQGGLNRYAADLAMAQAKAGDEVFALYPNGSLFPQKRAKIHETGTHGGVRCFSLTGGRCVPVLEGIREPQMILDPAKELSGDEIERFLQCVRPEVFHIHTWMGFPEELLPIAKAHGTKIIYTTHDYFGLCPMVNRLKEDGTVCQGASDEACSFCNRRAPSERYLELRNAETLIRLKSLLLLPKKFLHRRHEPVYTEAAPDRVSVKSFEKLREHYLALFQKCDKLHFNSPVTQAIFSDALPGSSGEVLAITHGGIADYRPEKVVVHEPLRLVFIGPAKPYKGLPMLLEVLRQLHSEGLVRWHLDVHGCEGVNSDSVTYHGSFQGDQEWAILRDADLLLVPSLWDETFGFVVAEALCAGVPVLCSDKVGAKILVDEQWIFAGKEGLLMKLRDVLSDTAAVLLEKQKLCKQKHFVSMGEHLSAMREFYRGA